MAVDGLSFPHFVIAFIFTRQQSSAGNEIAGQEQDIAGGIGQTSASINGVAKRPAQMKASPSPLRQQISYFQLIR